MTTHHRTTFTGVTDNADDGNTTGGNLALLASGGAGDTRGLAWELNIVERGGLSNLASYADDSDAADASDGKIDSVEAKLIANKCHRAFKYYLGSTNYTVAKVKKVIITIETVGV
jgi:hypothetical protein